MPDFKPGDRICVVHTDNIYIYIGEMGDHLYAVLDSPSRAGAPANRFSKVGWELAPTPFFEEGRTYRYKGDTFSGKYHYTVHHVFSMAGKRFAATLNGESLASIWTEEEFDGVEEV